MTDPRACDTTYPNASVLRTPRTPHSTTATSRARVVGVFGKLLEGIPEDRRIGAQRSLGCPWGFRRPADRKPQCDTELVGGEGKDNPKRQKKRNLWFLKGGWSAEQWIDDCFSYGGRFESHAWASRWGNKLPGRRDERSVGVCCNAARLTRTRWR